MINSSPKAQENMLIKSPIGIIYAGASKNFLLRLDFLKSSENLSPTQFSSSNSILNQLKRELNQYFDGKRRQFNLPHTLPPTPFSINVLEKVKSIPFGETISYTKLAENSGNIKSIRAVANVNANNNLLIVIRCHRVIGINDDLVGYAGGLSRKEWLLQHELKYTNKAYQTSLF